MLTYADKAELKAALAERNAAFESDDLDWARARMPGASDDRVIVMAFHKARLECKAVSDGKRIASQKWLADNHVKNFMGDLVKVGDPLPV